VTTVGATTTEAATASSLPEPGRPRPGRPATLLAELFDAHAALVLGTCRGMLRDRHEAEDAAQQTFLSAYASLLRGTVPREPAAWLATIARNECRTRIQQQMRRPLPVAEAYADTADSADQAAQAAEVESLRRALAELPRQQRRAFVMRELGGLSYEELAIALGVSGPAVESLLFRARQRLRLSLRAAAAAASSLPAGLRDFFTQFATGPSDAPATAAKLGSAPLLAKLAGVGAGAAFLTAGATSVIPMQHHAARRAAPAQRAVVAARPRHVSHVRSATVRPVVVAAPDPPARQVEHSRRIAHEQRDVVERSAPEPEPADHRGNSGPATSSSGSDDPAATAPENFVGGDTSEQSREGSVRMASSGDGGGTSSGDD
jgi:RNA polymerase sigma-70 factor (ECF subfamily)